MSTALVSPAALSGLVTTVGSDAEYRGYGGTKFLGRIEFASKGKTSGDGKKQIPMGNYCIPEGTQLRDLGNSIDVMPLARRRKAIDFSNLKALRVSHDPTSAEYKRIEEASADNESKCMEGPSFLLLERSTGRVYELFCASKGLKNASQELSGYLPLTEADCERRGLDPSMARGPMSCTLASRFRQTKYGTQFDPTVSDCSTPFADVAMSEADLVAEIEKFVNAKDSDVQPADESEAPSRDR